jgi:hypothetical protein
MAPAPVAEVRVLERSSGLASGLGRSEERGYVGRTGSGAGLGWRLSEGLLIRFGGRARAGHRIRVWQRVGVLVAVDGGEHPVRRRLVIHEGRQQVIGQGPLRRLAVHRAGERRVLRQVLDQHPEPARGELPAVPIQEIDAVEAEQIGFEGLGVLLDELAEAQPSPRLSPVSEP